MEVPALFNRVTKFVHVTAEGPCLVAGDNAAQDCLVLFPAFREIIRLPGRRMIDRRPRDISDQPLANPGKAEARLKFLLAYMLFLHLRSHESQSRLRRGSLVQKRCATARRGNSFA